MSASVYAAGSVSAILASAASRLFAPQFISWPPVTLSATPVMYEDASEARNVTALQTSS